MRILWLKTELLHPVDKGGKIRTYHMLRELKKRHHITYLCLDDGTADAVALEKADEYAHQVVTVEHKVSRKFTLAFYLELIRNLRSPLPYALEKYVSKDLRGSVESMTRTGEFDLLICDFLAPAVCVPRDVPIPTLLFQHNVEAMIWRRHSEVAANPIKKAYFNLQWKRMSRFEEESCRRFDWVVAVSEEDAETMKHDYGVSNISHVPTGVDTDYFRPTEPAEPFHNQIVFTGSMDWVPNEDGIQWFVTEVLPIVQQKIPDVALTVVGRNPSPSLEQLATSDRTINITGRVPDVRPYMGRANVFVVPIRIGGGTRLKIYEAMAMGLPVVSTTIGAEGLDVSDEFDILLRDDPGAFAEAIVALLSNKELAHRLGQAAADRVRTNNSWQSVAADFDASCHRAVQQRRLSDQSGSGIASTDMSQSKLPAHFDNFESKSGVILKSEN